MSKEALQKQQFDALNELEKQVLETLSKVPLNILTSTRWLNLAKDNIQTGFMCARRSVMKPEDK